MNAALQFINVIIVNSVGAIWMVCLNGMKTKVTEYFLLLKLQHFETTVDRLLYSMLLMELDNLELLYTATVPYFLTTLSDFLRLAVFVLMDFQSLDSTSIAK